MIEDVIINEPTPQNVQLRAYYKQSFAYYTVKERLPVILTKVVDYLVRDKEIIISRYGDRAREELKDVIGRISKLKQNIQTNKKLESLLSDARDVSIWNQYLESFDVEQTYFTSVWLYVECYVYRKLREAFELTTSLKSFDYFRKQKEEALLNSLPSLSALTSHLNLITTENDLDKESIKSEFTRMLKLNLWGNRADLSISSGAENSQTCDPMAQIDSLDAYILANDISQIWDHLNSDLSENTIIDIVCDNSGYEVFIDICLADFLLSHNLAHKIIFHVKEIPWFISDVTPHDFEYTINSLKENTNELLGNLGNKWKKYLEEGKFQVKVDTFWTLMYEHHHMKEIDPELYNHLSQAKLVIFKGDLNYRKLLGELNWDPTTSFKTALQGFLPSSVAALRTIKADLVSGLKEGVAEKLNQKDPNWMTTGEYGLIQFAQK